MSKYNQQTTTGESWQRCYSVTIENPFNNTPTAIFREEIVVQVGDNTINQPKTVCTLTFNPTAEFAVLDPQTGQPTGQNMTHQQLYNYIYSLYIKTATDRDNQTFGPIV